MTIAIGCLYRDGALISADTEVTYGDSLKTQASKVSMFSHRASRLAISYAGSVPFAKMFIEECKRVFPEFADRSKAELRKCIADGLLEFYKSRIYPHPMYRQVGGPDFWLIVGIWSEVDGLDLFSTDDTALNSIETYACVGAGEYLARYILEQSFRSDWTSQDAARAVKTTLQTVKTHVPYCGGASDFVFLGKDSAAASAGL